MNKTSKACAALLMAGASLGASMSASAETTTSTTRDQRMDAALQDYRNGQPANAGTGRTTSATRMNASGEGRVARGEDSVKSAGRKTGHAIAEGSRDAGHAVAQGARKTGHAIHNAEKKVTGQPTDGASK